MQRHRLWLVLSVSVAAALLSICVAFQPLHNTHRLSRTSSNKVMIRNGIANHDSISSVGATRTISTSYETSLSSDEDKTRQPSKRERLRKIFRRKDAQNQTSQHFAYDYNYNEMVIDGSSVHNTTKAVMLIHPIGVGIGKWYYDRLLQSLQDMKSKGDDNINNAHSPRFVCVVPDLLGSATAYTSSATKLPLLNITNWSDQITQLMSEYETQSKADGHVINSWSVVANGGCAPIALSVAATSLQKKDTATLTNVIISSPPRLPFFLDSTDPMKVRKSYKTLCGITGSLFWWYALRRNGKFIQTFSERNLVGNATTLGPKWTPNCLEAAKLHKGQSRYSTFAFLAGALQDGCIDSLNILKGSNVSIDFIRGTDKRRNRAKSWFWSRKKKKADETKADAAPPEPTIQDYVADNGNRGKELFIGGRISLAWEDPDGYAQSMMKLITE